MFVEVTREKMVGCFFAHPLPHHEKGKGKASPGGKRSPISISKCSWDFWNLQNIWKQLFN